MPENTGGRPSNESKFKALEDRADNLEGAVNQVAETLSGLTAMIGQMNERVEEDRKAREAEAQAREKLEEARAAEDLDLRRQVNPSAVIPEHSRRLTPKHTISVKDIPFDEEGYVRFQTRQGKNHVHVAKAGKRIIIDNEVVQIDPINAEFENHSFRTDHVDTIISLMESEDFKKGEVWIIDNQNLPVRVGPAITEGARHTGSRSEELSAALPS